MTDDSDRAMNASVFPIRAAYIIALIFVAIGVINSTGVILEWDALWQELSGIENLKNRSFATEWFYPIVFSIMMLVVVLKHSMWRAWNGARRLWPLHGCSTFRLSRRHFPHLSDRDRQCMPD